MQLWAVSRHSLLLTLPLPGTSPRPQVFREDGLVYMVLEYGDIDLARLLHSHEEARRRAAGGGEAAEAAAAGSGNQCQVRSGAHRHRHGHGHIRV